MTYLKFCTCVGCKAGRHKPKGKRIIKAASRKFRHDSKAALRKGAEPPRAVSVSMTD